MEEKFKNFKISIFKDVMGIDDYKEEQFEESKVIKGITSKIENEINNFICELKDNEDMRKKQILI